MILIKQKIESRMASLIADAIIEDNLPIHLDIGVSSGGYTDVLLSYEKQDESVYKNLIKAVSDPIYLL